MSASGRPVGRVAAGLRDVATAASEGESAEELVATAIESLTTTLDFGRAAYLRYRDGALRPMEGDEAETSDAAPVIEVDLDDDPALAAVFANGRAVRIEVPARRSLEPFLEHEGMIDPVVAVPVRRAIGPVGLLLLADPEREIDRRTIDVATVYGALLGVGLAAVVRADRLEQLRVVLQERNELLTEEQSGDADACRALEASVSRPMRRLVHMAKQVATTDAPVLITGETGTGKEVLARAIHEWGHRADGPFVQLNCAALSDQLIESELFGHVKGAFSGAVSDRAGRFRVADGGTLLLDEIGEMGLEAQTKLLRVLEVGAVLPVGADRTVPVDVRIIAATNVDLDLAIDQGHFREDLYFRLHVFPLVIPPLRERVEDIPVLVSELLTRMRRKTGHGPWRVEEDELERLKQYPWPGNVRELVNALERARVFSPLGGTLEVDLGVRQARRGRRKARRKWPTLDEHRRVYLEEVLRHTNGKIYGPGGAAELLEIPPSTLQSRLRRLGVERLPEG